MNINIDEIKKIEVLGGMTNYNYKVCLKNEYYILRIPGEGSNSIINRRYEKKNTIIVDKLGIDSECIYFNEDSGIKVSKYIDNAQTMNSNLAKSEENMKLVAIALKKLHNSNYVFENEFNVIDKINEYENALKNSSNKNYSDYELIKSEIIKLQEVLKKIGVESRLCHNDTVPENFIKNNSRIYLIDWEYSGMNDPMWDVAAYLLECGFSQDEEELFLNIYFDENINSANRTKILIYKIYQDFLWSIWANIKKVNGVDYGDYGIKRYNRAKTNLKKITDFI